MLSVAWTLIISPIALVCKNVRATCKVKRTKLTQVIKFRGPGLTQKWFTEHLLPIRHFCLASNYHLEKQMHTYHDQQLYLKESLPEETQWSKEYLCSHGLPSSPPHLQFLHTQKCIWVSGNKKVTGKDKVSFSMRSSVPEAWRKQQPQAIRRAAWSISDRKLA